MNTFVLALLASSKSLLEELWDYFVENYLEADTVYYNLGMEGNSMVSIPIIVAGICIGTVIAVIAVMRDNRVIGSYVRKMLDGGHVGRENAVTLEELGSDMRSSFGKALRRSATLRRYVRCVEEECFYDALQGDDGEEPGEKDKKNSEYKYVGEEHFYIVEDKRIGAEFKYDERSVKWWVLPVIFVAVVVVFFALLLVIPYLLSLTDSFVGSFGGDV